LKEFIKQSIIHKKDAEENIIIHPEILPLDAGERLFQKKKPKTCLKYRHILRKKSENSNLFIQTNKRYNDFF